MPNALFVKVTVFCLTVVLQIATYAGQIGASSSGEYEDVLWSSFDTNGMATGARQLPSFEHSVELFMKTVEPDPLYSGGPGGTNLIPKYYSLRGGPRAALAMFDSTGRQLALTRIGRGVAPSGGKLSLGYFSRDRYSVLRAHPFESHVWRIGAINVTNCFEIWTNGVYELRIGPTIYRPEKGNLLPVKLPVLSMPFKRSSAHH